VSAGSGERHTGIVPAAQAQSMTGLEFLRAWVSGRVPPPPIGAVFDFDLVEVEEGRVVFAGTPDARYFNPIGSVHGGYAATLLDSCMGCAVHSRLAVGQGYTTADITIHYVRGMNERTGKVFAEGRVVHFGRQMATAEGHLRDAAGRVLAHGTTTCLVFTPPGS